MNMDDKRTMNWEKMEWYIEIIKKITIKKEGVGYTRNQANKKTGKDDGNRNTTNCGDGQQQKENSRNRNMYLKFGHIQYSAVQTRKELVQKCGTLTVFMTHKNEKKPIKKHFQKDYSNIKL